MDDDFNVAAAQKPPAGRLVGAAWQNRPAAVRAWLREGSDVNEKNRFGQTALMIVVRHGDMQLAHMLIQLDAAVNEKDNDGETALMIAAQTNNEDAARLLISYGAALDERDDNGQTAVVWAVKCGQKNVLRLLIDKGASLDGAAEALRYAPEADKREFGPLLEEAEASRTAAVANHAAAVEQSRQAAVRERQLRLNGRAPPVRVNRESRP